LCNLLCKSELNWIHLGVTFDSTTICIFRYAQLCRKLMHQNFALTFVNALLTLLASTVERVGTIILSRPEVD
jgi:hypothetical protein